MVPLSADWCRSFRDTPSQARPQAFRSGLAYRLDNNSRTLGQRIGLANLKSAIGRDPKRLGRHINLSAVMPDSVGAPDRSGRYSLSGERGDFGVG